MRKAIWLLSVALAVLAVSCGSETEDAQTTSVAPTPDTLATTTTAESGTATAAGAADSSGSGSDPDALNDLVAPGAVLLRETSSGIKILTSTASFDDTVAYYEEVLGEGPVNVDGAAGDRVASFLAETPVDVLVQVEEDGDALLIYITVKG
jgi:hypothetical protein